MGGEEGRVKERKTERERYSILPQKLHWRKRCVAYYTQRSVCFASTYVCFAGKFAALIITQCAGQ